MVFISAKEILMKKARENNSNWVIRDSNHEMKYPRNKQKPTLYKPSKKVKIPTHTENQEKAALAICRWVLLTFLSSLQATMLQLQTEAIQLLSEGNICTKTPAVTSKHNQLNLPPLAFFKMQLLPVLDSDQDVKNHSNCYLFPLPPTLCNLNRKWLLWLLFAYYFSLRACV